MAGSVFDSQIFNELFPTGEFRELFSDNAEICAMIRVEGELAKIQGQQGIIPKISSEAIHQAAMKLQLDPRELTKATGQNGVSVPGLVALFQKSLQSPEHAQYVHFGATSQDIMDTGLMLRLRQMLILQERSLKTLLVRLAELAQKHAELPMVARTYGQDATLTSFGATVATWGNPLVDLLNALPELRKKSLWISLSGAAGTNAALGKNAADLRDRLAENLWLFDPKRSWHSDRSPILRIVEWQSALSTALGKMADDILIMCQSNIKTLNLSKSGISSTMPQKENPISPCAISSLSRFAIGQQSIMKQAAFHKEARDGAAWLIEWLALPQLCLAASSALLITNEVFDKLFADKDAMQYDIARTRGFVYAESLSFELGKIKPRPEAAAEVKKLCELLQKNDKNLLEAAKDKWPELAISNLDTSLGEAPQFALSFVANVKDST